jgi:hypothetical protein
LQHWHGRFWVITCAIYDLGIVHGGADLRVGVPMDEVLEARRVSRKGNGWVAIAGLPDGHVGDQ